MKMMDVLIARNRLLKEIREVYEYNYPTASGEFDEFVTRILPNIVCNQPTVGDIQVELVKELKEIGKSRPYFEKVGCNTEQKDGEMR